MQIRQPATVTSQASRPSQKERLGFGGSLARLLGVFEAPKKLGLEREPAKEPSLIGGTFGSFHFERMSHVIPLGMPARHLLFVDIR